MSAPHPLDPCQQLAAVMTRIYRGRLTTLSGGNLSILDDNGDLWITPAATDKGRMTPQDVVCLKADGTVEGRHRPSSEYPMHLAIYAARPDVRAIVHAHPAALVTFCVTHQVPDTRLAAHTWRLCGPTGSAPYVRPGSQELGDTIAAAFARGHNLVLLENHGATAAGPDLLTAYWRLEALDWAARVELHARRLGQPAPLTEAQLLLAPAGAPPLPEFTPLRRAAGETALRRQVVEALRLAGDKGLMTATQGAISARLGARRLVITPADLDRRSVGVDDLVLVREGARQAGRIPSRWVGLHTAIYDTYPQVDCVIVAPLPHATALAVTADSQRAYDLPRCSVLPYGAWLDNPQAAAQALTPPGSTPLEPNEALLLQNEGVLVVGRGVPETLDRLERVELAAAALIAARG